MTSRAALDGPCPAGLLVSMRGRGLRRRCLLVKPWKCRASCLIPGLACPKDTETEVEPAAANAVLAPNLRLRQRSPLQGRLERYIAR